MSAAADRDFEVALTGVSDGCGHVALVEAARDYGWSAVDCSVPDLSSFVVGRVIFGQQ
jgi:hypothetical protein